MARPKFSPTAQDRATVRYMTMAGIQRDVICRCIFNPETESPISENTLAKYFRDELDQSDAQANGKVVASLFRTATGPPSGPQVTAAIFWAKTKLGWREVQRIEHGGSIAIENMTKEQLVAVLGQDD